MPEKNITEQPMSDKTGRKILQVLEKATILPSTGLSIVNGKLCMTFTVEDYDPARADGYSAGELCCVTEGGVEVIKRCVTETPKPAGAYDSTCWVDADIEEV